MSQYLVSRKSLVALVLTMLGLLLLPAAASAQLPDPMDRGPYTPATLDPFNAGRFDLHEPNSDGGNATGSASAESFQVRGSAYYPADRTEPSPLIVLVHGNHTQCDSGSSPNCSVFKRNDSGYAYLGENLATWGYTTISLDQDQLMSRQDGAKGKGMHQRRLLIAAALDAFYAANEEAQPAGPDNNLGSIFTGKVDMTRIGLMGHSRGGDAVSSFIDYNRMRPVGRRYPLRGVISLAPVDYERKAPYGTPYMTILPWCDGDVSNLQGARFFERSQYIDPSDPFPRIQSSQLGANHNWYNSVWFADGQDGNSGSDSACRDTQPNNSRLSGQAFPGAYVINNSDKLNPEVNTRISGDPARMGDQEKIGLATMSAFFRRYVGGEGAFDPYMTGELSEQEIPQIPETACPTSTSGTRMECIERVSTSYFAAPDERLDVIRPETTNPLGLSALGTALVGSGFSNPYENSEGIAPNTGFDAPEDTADGFDWCNPEPLHFAPAELSLPYSNSNPPLAAKPCPLPDLSGIGSQSGNRERSPVNHSYGRQLALAWDDEAKLGTEIPASYSDVTGFKALAMGADVNYFDTRNPERTGTSAEWDPAQTTQDFEIKLTDADGNSGSVDAGDPAWGNALHQSTGSTTTRLHIVLDQIRIPLDEFADQGVDLTKVAELELLFGGEGYPETGSIQLSDVRFQEAAEGTDVLVDSTAPDAGPATGPVTSGPDPAAVLEAYDRDAGQVKLPDVSAAEGSNTWTVDDDGAECPNASFTKIQDAVDYAAPWDTIVVCDGTYYEKSPTYFGVQFPAHDPASPVQSGARNGLTISKPLRIEGTGADKVSIQPDPSLAPSLAGTQPYLRDGGGNVITVSRQSLGSTDDNEHFVEISGVTVESPSIYAEAGIAFHNASGKVVSSVVGPLKRATNGSQLSSMPHGWGIVSTNSLLGSGPGTVTRQVTVEDSLVTGYQSGGILFDGGRGTDGNAGNNTDMGILHEGYVKDTFVEGKGANGLIPQVGIKYANGFDGFVTGSRITGNLFPSNQRKSIGILLTDAATEGDWFAEGNVISGNGYGLFNANATDDGVREASPAMATGNFWGDGGPPTEAESAAAFGVEGISGDDTLGDDSVIYDPILSEAPDVPSGAPGPVADAAPTAKLLAPVDGSEIPYDVEIEPLVKAGDDFGVSSVAITADGEALEGSATAPYVFSFTPTPAQAGDTVTLEATVTDSSGQTTTDSVEVEVTELPPLPTLEIDGVTKDKKKGTALVAFTISDPGAVDLTGKNVKPAGKTYLEAASDSLTVKPTGKLKKKLKKKGKAKVTVTVAYSPDGDFYGEGGEYGPTTITEKVKVSLAKKLKKRR